MRMSKEEAGGCCVALGRGRMVAALTSQTRSRFADYPRFSSQPLSLLSLARRDENQGTVVAPRGPVAVGEKSEAR